MSKKKKIAILAMQESYEGLKDQKYTRFPEELSEMGYEHDILFFDKFFVRLSEKRIDYFYQEKVFDPFEYELFLAIGGGLNGKSFLLESLEMSGHKVKNKISAIDLAGDKMRTHLVLNQAGIRTVDSAINFSQYFLGPLLDSWEGEEYVCKLRRGSLGKGVSYLNSNLSLVSVFELISSLGLKAGEVFFERYIKESFGEDFRLIVAKGEVIASMQRKSNGFDFRANLFGGGKARKIEPSPEMTDMALEATEALGLDYAGVDFLASNEGPLIVEVNSNPGLKIEEVTGINVSREILKRIV
jgi:ribosomal protein S6--L-glutamate ligase